MLNLGRTYEIEQFSKSQAEFDQFYESQLKPKIEEMQRMQDESLEQATKIAKKLTLPLILAVGMTIWFKQWAFIIIFIVYALFRLRHFLNDGDQYGKRMKQEIIPDIIKFLNPNFEYEPNNLVPFRYFVRANVFTDEPNRYGGKDLIKGFVGKDEPTKEDPYPVNTKLMFSRIQAGNLYEYEDHQGRKKERFYQMFRGTFFVADFNKNFKGTTLVVPRKDLRSRKILTFLRLQEKTEFIEVELENPFFMEKFAILTTDEIKARYILTPAFMERLLEFTERNKRLGSLNQTDMKDDKESDYSKTPYFSFRDGIMYFLLPSEKDYLEYESYRMTLSKSLIDEYFHDINMSLRLVDELNLNLRIWNKE